jgi:hypothetical protein
MGRRGTGEHTRGSLYLAESTPAPRFAGPPAVLCDAGGVSATPLQTPAWLMRGVITYDAKPGSLRLDGGRLTFRGSAGETPIFDIALDDIDNVKFPRYNLGSVVRFDAGDTRYRLAFLASEHRFTWSGARISDLRPARRWGKQWKAALRAR